jgi:hypothetical protein
MPCRTNRLRVVVPRDVPSEQQWAYDTARPLDEDEVKKNVVDDSAAITDENVCVERNELVNAKVSREVPYYDSAEEEELVEVDALPVLPPADAISVPQPDTVGAAAATVAAAVVELPDVEAVVHRLFPTTAAVPPPPPSMTGSVQAMRFWHRRLLSHPIYERCVRLLRDECPAPPANNSSTEVQQAWMGACDQWWNALAEFVKRTSSTYKLPGDMMWNPYSFTNSIKYIRSQPPLRLESGSGDVSQTITSARYFLPPPPAYHVVVAEYQRLVSDEEAVRAYVACLTSWWRRACEWAAAANREHPWVNPPPTTGANAEAWEEECGLWRSYTEEQLRDEEHRNKTTELQRMMAAFQMQQQQTESSLMPSTNTFPSQINYL